MNSVSGQKYFCLGIFLGTKEVQFLFYVYGRGTISIKTIELKEKALNRRAKLAVSQRPGEKTEIQASATI